MNNRKLADFIKREPRLLDFLDRFGIKLGFGDATIGEIANKYEIELYFFKEMILLISNIHGFNPRYIEKFEINSTVNFLKNSHKSYLEEFLPKIEYLINELKMAEKERAKDCEILHKYFFDYKSEFETHLEYEDKDIFPYILSISQTAKDSKYTEQIVESIKNHSITNYIKQHESLDEKLNDLQNLLIKYFKPFKRNDIIKSLLKITYELEEDLLIHDLIENQILFPQAQKIEELILNSFEEIQND